MWRSVATSLLLLLLGALTTPFVQAQDPDLGVPPCCRMMAGRAGCSMRMHRAAAEQKLLRQMVEQYDRSHQVASVQARCQCTALAQTGVAPHDMPLAATSAEVALLPEARAPAAVAIAGDVCRRDGGDETRGPPMTLTA